MLRSIIDKKGKFTSPGFTQLLITQVGWNGQYFRWTVLLRKKYFLNADCEGLLKNYLLRYLLQMSPLPLSPSLPSVSRTRAAICFAVNAMKF